MKKFEISIWRRLFLEIGKVSTAFCFIILIMLGVNFWQKSPIQTFFNQLFSQQSLEEVKKLAESSTFPIIEKADNQQTSLIISNHLSPFFRYSCIVNFINHQLVDKTLLYND